MSRTSSLAVLLGLALAACARPAVRAASTTTPADAATTATTTVQEDRYAVLSAAARAVARREPRKEAPGEDVKGGVGRLIIIGETDPDAPAQFPGYSKWGEPFASAQAMARYPAAPKHSLEREFTDIGDYALLPVDSMRALSAANFWPAFHRRYPDAFGLIALSPVAFDDTRSEAVVHVAYHRDENWGYTAVMHFERGAHGWTRTATKYLLEF